MRLLKLLQHIGGILLPWLLVASFVYFNHKQEVVLWPSNREPVIYSDSVTKDRGNSGIRRLLSPSGTISYEYCLGDKILYPYIGVSFGLDTAQKFFDLSRYDLVEIELDAHLSRRIPVVINQDVEGFSKEREGLSFRPFMKEIVYEKGKRLYQLKLSDFETPAWWYSKHKLTEHEVGSPDFSRINTIQLHDCELISKNTTETFTIYRLAFKKDMTLWYGLSLAFLALYYIGWYLVRYFTRSGPIVLPRRELDVSNIADEEGKKIIAYLGENYSNSELSLDLVQKELGLSEAKISGSIKEIAGMTFKKYLNNIRLEEAKRLLLLTDRPIMDIAYKVGYGNVSHFNRVFKEAESCSPNEYRKNTAKKS